MSWQLAIANLTAVYVPPPEPKKPHVRDLKFWTPEELEILFKYAPNWYEIGDMLNRTKAAVKGKYFKYSREVRNAGISGNT